MELSNRLQEVLAYSKLSVRGMALRCGLKQQTLDKHIKGVAEPSATTLTAIAVNFPEISADWLLCGEGEMLRSSNKEAERISKLIDTITTLQDAINTKSETIATLTEQIKKLENKK